MRKGRKGAKGRRGEREKAAYNKHIFVPCTFLPVSQCRQLKGKNSQSNKTISVIVVQTPEGVKYG
ncbi:MAG: hypothetical protein LBL13_06115 [Bacteroidales bacterium]|nr:hypothetical protein [Bacteroidales bacterium]